MAYPNNISRKRKDRPNDTSPIYTLIDDRKNKDRKLTDVYGYYSLAHFANRNMSPELTDALMLSGIAQYNVQSRYLRTIQRMTPIEQQQNT